MAYDFFGTEDTSTRQIHYLQPICHYSSLRLGKFKKLFLELCIGDQDLIGQPYEDLKERCLPQIDKAATVTDDDPHPPSAALSNLRPLR